MLLALGIILFIGLIMFHEWGHFMAAHRNGVETEEFGLGFPPRLWGKRLRAHKGDKTLYSINLLPLGGFVKMKGEHDEATGKGSFGAARLRGKAKILLAGVFMNLIAAYFIFMLLAIVGMPKVIDNQFTINRDTKIIREVKDKDVVLVGKVGDDTPAQKAGLKVDDRILRVDDTTITSPEDLIAINKAHAGKSVTLTYSRDNKETTVPIILSDNTDGKGYLGVSPMSGASGIQLQRSTWSAPVVAGGLIGQVTALTFKGLIS
jgi:regulator of sigma E protease